MKVRNLIKTGERFAGFIIIDGNSVPVNGSFEVIDFKGGVYDLGDKLVTEVYFRPAPGRPEVRVRWRFEASASRLSHWESDGSQWGIVAVHLLDSNNVSP